MNPFVTVLRYSRNELYEPGATLPRAVRRTSLGYRYSGSTAQDHEKELHSRCSRARRHPPRFGDNEDFQITLGHRYDAREINDGWRDPLAGRTFLRVY